jgi:hypothetical protein
MNTRRLFPTIFGTMALATFVASPNAQMTEQAAREQASNIARSELQSTVHFRADQFLGIHRDEDLEQSLAIASIGWRAGQKFIYRVSPAGFEIRENAVVNHTYVEVDPLLIVAVNSADGSTYGIHGFGRRESLAEFERLMTASKMRASSPDQAESIADFYRAVNPENQEALSPILSLLELKQAAERQCQGEAKSFEVGENAFTSWWKHAESSYASLSFQQKVVPRGSGYLVEWIVLSSPSADNCGGAPLRARLEIKSDGEVGELTFAVL